MSSTCIPTAAIVADKSAAAAAVTSAASSSSPSRLRYYRRHSFSNVVLPLSNANLQLFSQAGIGGSSTGAAQSKSEAPAKEIKNGKPSSKSVPTQLASEESISEFITQVASLVKLVDSRDIVELQLKQHDCELMIRKKEAISQMSSPPVHMMQAPSAPPSPPPPPQASPNVSAAPAPAPTASPASAPPAAKPAKSSVPPLKSPMAGTFYRSPAPGAPAFVKVGDKVQKGQIVCIIEAMKLMNEIEADQAGTVVDIIAEDGKPVSLDSPLLVIQP
ncbi:Biotin carboxyl carrier protein of acetyl-CoA carboxylase chloroplastic [Bienertia sinuspersici]